MRLSCYKQRKEMLSSCSSLVPPFIIILATRSFHGMFSVLVGSTVGVATETADARDDTVGAGGALGQRTLDGEAMVADAEGVVAQADDCAVFGARGRVARRGVVATSIG
jgi:hypothetical protein